MNEYLLEPFLTQYYLFESICGDFITDKEKSNIFYEYANIFCLPKNDELDAYYNDSNSDPFCDINDLSSYGRLCRTIEFAQKSGQTVGLTQRDRMILSKKREALMIKSEFFKQNKNLTQETVNTILLNLATNGSIDAMALVSFMEFHGICICSDSENAIKRIRLCAKWNNIFGNLMGLAYDKENRQEYFDNLYTILRNANQKQIFDHICSVKGFDGNCTKNPIARIIEKAFGLNIANRNFYDKVFAKVAFSELISSEDKEKLLLNKQKDAIVSLSDIPFDVKGNDDNVFNRDCIKQLPIMRETEILKIIQNLEIARSCPDEVYTPLLIVAPDEFISSMYHDFIKKGFEDCPVIELDAGTLTPQDFYGTRENVFLRGIAETKSARTVFVVKDCEEMENEQLEEFIKVFDYEYRRKYKLFQPPVSLDLSGIRFVFLANGRDTLVTKLAEHCDTVWAQNVSAQEKDSVVSSVITSRVKSFGCDKVVIDDDCRKYLASFGGKQLQQIVDSALKRAIFEKEYNVTLDTLKKICKEQNISTTKRGFGYTGGEQYA